MKRLLHISLHQQLKVLTLAALAMTYQLFVAEIFASERPCLTGAVDFPTQLGEVLKRWGSRVPVEQALTVWTNIEVDEGVVELIERMLADAEVVK